MSLLRPVLCLTFMAVLSACSSSEVLPAPKSDKNFDDPDDPGNSGTVGAVDASTKDAGSGVVPCAKSSDCPSSDYTCYFAVDDGCSAQGRCIVYQVTSGCLSHTRCSCNDKTIKECAPEGFASAPAKSDGACGSQNDAGNDAPSDAPSDSAGD